MLRFIVWRVIAPLARPLFRPTIEGQAQLPASGPVIVAANHLSFIDSVVLSLAAPRPIAFLAKAEYFNGRGLKGRLLRCFFVALGAVPVTRGTYLSARASLDQATRVLAGGDPFAIYPEGTRSLNGKLHRGRTGVAWLTLTTRAPVVPAALSGTQHIQPVGTRLPRIHPVTVRFGAPLRFDDLDNTARNRRTVTDRIMTEIAALSGQERANFYHPVGSG